ncbi:hypothetical protein BU16DRAFT_144941 [Lophium mytilinum]|uniref:Uncharacterized protein n=1 Tax=Lophium mytilinum TaxID=390894 RepID=A0A6A6QGN3_9PEZI|nr:hypothetical protein BU16DRAFT_144941 [Lophium mytilinum]
MALYLFNFRTGRTNANYKEYRHAKSVAPTSWREQPRGAVPACHYHSLPPRPSGPISKGTVGALSPQSRRFGALIGVSGPERERTVPHVVGAGAGSSPCTSGAAHAVSRVARMLLLQQSIILVPAGEACCNDAAVTISLRFTCGLASARAVRDATEPIVIGHSVLGDAEDRRGAAPQQCKATCFHSIHHSLQCDRNHRKSAYVH